MAENLVMSDAVRAHVHITGRVQGVFYRASCQEQARRLGLNGWVCNLPDGRVEVVLEGGKLVVEEMIRWCHHGPSGAAVSGVEMVWEPIRGESSFSITG